MIARSPMHEKQFQIWVARVKNWRPKHWSDTPSSAIALQQAEKRLMDRRTAAAYVKAFNKLRLNHNSNIWAVAVPVTVRVTGAPRPNEILNPSRIAQFNEQMLKTGANATEPQTDPEEQ